MEGSKLLVATDLSDNAKVAARWAHRFSELSGLPVDVAYVVPINIPNWVTGAYDLEDNEVVRDKAEQKAIDWYRDVTGEVPDRVKVRAGSAAEELRGVAEQDDYAAMVVAMSGKGALERLFVGSTASALALDPPCPIVIAHPDEFGLDGETEVCVGTDFSESSERAVDVAAELANLLGVSMHIVHATAADLEEVVEPEEVPEELRSETRYKEAKERLEQIGEDHGTLLGDQDFQTTVVKDYPPHAIHELADTTDIGIAVVGESHRSKLSQTVVGSVGLKLVQEMPATVIIVPGAKGERDKG